MAFTLSKASLARECVTGNIIINGTIVGTSTYCWIPITAGAIDDGTGILDDLIWPVGGGDPSLSLGGEMSTDWIPETKVHDNTSCSDTIPSRQATASASFNAWALDNLTALERFAPDGELYLINFNGGDHQIFRWNNVSQTVALEIVIGLECQNS